MRKPLDVLTTIVELSTEKLLNAGKKIIFLDADNTLFLPKVALEYQKIEHIEKKLIELQNADFEIVILSNNFSQDRCDFFQKLTIHTIFFARKPLSFSYKKAHKFAEKKLNRSIAKDEIIHIGDQFITDALGSIFYGIDYIIIKPIDENSDLIFAKPSRFLERIFKIHSGKEDNHEKD